MVWREPRKHADDWYFCLTNITGFNASSRKKIKYPNLRSAMRPVPHSDDLSVPTPPVNKDLLSSSDEEMLSREDSAESISLEDIESTYSGTSGNEPHWITQEDLNDLARDLYLSKQQSELLASRLKQWDLVQEDVRITRFRKRNKLGHRSSYGYTSGLHFLHSHLNFFPPNLGAVSDEHRERFHQDITKMESNYQGKWNSGMMGDFCWMLLHDIPEEKYTRSSEKTHFSLSVVLWIV